MNQIFVGLFVNLDKNYCYSKFKRTSFIQHIKLSLRLILRTTMLAVFYFKLENFSSILYSSGKPGKKFLVITNSFKMQFILLSTVSTLGYLIFCPTSYTFMRMPRGMTDGIPPRIVLIQRILGSMFHEVQSPSWSPV